MATAMIGFRQTVEQAEVVLDSLYEGGFASREISILLPDRREMRHFAYVKSTNKSPQVSARGIGIPGQPGGALRWLASVGPRSIHGVGAFIGAGPLSEAIDQNDSMADALASIGTSASEALEHERMLRMGLILIAVHSEERDERSHARRILEGLDVSEVLRVSAGPA